MQNGEDLAERRPGRAARGLWVVLGSAALALGAIGAILPLLPTTPFVILAAAAFSKGSPRLHAALERHRTFGPIIAAWRAEGAIAPRYKVIAVAMMALTFALSLAVGVSAFVLIVQAVCLGGAATFVLTRPGGTAP